jgi:hypothetical protein
MMAGGLHRVGQMNRPLVFLLKMSNSTDWGTLIKVKYKWYEFWNWGKKELKNENSWTP